MKYKAGIFILGMVLSVVGPVFLSSLPARAASSFQNQSVTATFLDANLIQVTASGTYTLPDGSTVNLSQVSGTYYNQYPGKDGNGHLTYQQGGYKSPPACASTIQVTDNIPQWSIIGAHGEGLQVSGGDPTKPVLGILSLKLSPSGTTQRSGCVQASYPGKITINNPIIDSVQNWPADWIGYVQIDPQTIVQADQDIRFDSTQSSPKYIATTITNGPSSGPHVIFEKNDKSQCPNYIDPSPGVEVANDSYDVQFVWQTSGGGGGSCTSSGSSPIFAVLGSDNAYISPVQPPSASQTPTSGGSGSGGTGGSSTGSTTNPPGFDCSVQFFNPLSWVLCPLAVTFQTLAASLDNQIAGMLTVKTCTDTTQTSASSNTLCNFYGTWRAIRDISLGLIVIAVLIAIISQALGLEILDAYSIKKALPRVIAVAIGITLAWPLMMLVIGITNDLGTGIRELIYSAVSSSKVPYNVPLGGGGTAVGGLLVSAGIAALGFAGLLSFAVTAALAVAIAFIILVLRQMVIALLVIFSPIALVCYVLPNTQKAWKLWWESFSKALLMFPIIMAFIALGHVFASISAQGTGTFDQIFAFVAYFAPYMLLPYTFRLAGGALGTIGGAIHGGSKGMFGGLKQYRGKKVQSNFRAMQENRRFNPNAGGLMGRVNRGVNASLSNITSPGAAAKIYGGRALRGMGLKNSVGLGILNEIDQQKLTHSQKAAERMNTMFNDRSLSALMEMTDWSAGSIRKKAEELERSGNGNDRLAASQLRSGATWLASEMYRDPDMARANIGMAAGLANAAQGFVDTNQIADVANNLGGTESGLAAAFVAQAQLSAMRAGRMDSKPGYGVLTGANGKYTGTKIKKRDVKNDAGEVIGQEIDSKPDEVARFTGNQVRRIKTMSQQELQSAKGGAVKDLTEGFKQILQTPLDSEGKGSYSWTNERGEKESVEITRADVDRVAAMMGTAVADYSGTSPDTAREIQNIVNSSKLDEDAANAFRRGSRQLSAEELAQQQGGPPSASDTSEPAH